MEEDKREIGFSKLAGGPVLYFAGGGFDEREMLYYRLRCPYGVIGTDGQMQVVHHRRDYPIMDVVEVDGHRFVARQMDRYVLFRDLDSPTAEDALFLPSTSLSEFAETYRRYRSGRCIMHIPGGMDAVYCVYLFFHRLGTGFALYLDFRKDIETVPWAIEYERVDFWWGDIPRNWPGTADFLSSPVAPLRGLCDLLFEERIDPYRRDTHIERDKLEDMQHLSETDDESGVGSGEDYSFQAEDTLISWLSDSERKLLELDREEDADDLDILFLGPSDYEIDDVPISWQSGSEQELRWLSHAICSTEPDLFNVQEPVTAVYRAATSDKRGGFLHVERKQERFTSRRLMSLCDLAFRRNPCIGMRWKVRWKRPIDNDWGPSCYLEKTPERVKILVEPPSAHEKAEAFLNLLDWLDDNLYDPEKRARFGLAPRVAEEARREER